MLEQDQAAARGERLIARVERAYLTALRVALLLLATGLIAYAAWLVVSGTWQWSRNATSVTEAPVTVTAQEVAVPAAETPETAQAATDPLTSERGFYRDFTNRYYRLYTSRYERFRQANDARLSRASFDDRFVGAARRLEAVGEGRASFNDDRVALERLLATMTSVATLPETVGRLERYRQAVRTKSSRRVSGTRSERFCSYYGSYIDACLLYDTRQVPVSRTVTEMRLPAGVVDPATLFGRQQARFLDLWSSRTQESRATASATRERILAGNAAGSSRLWLSLSVLGGFLILMFLFLLIAIERHQRRLAAMFDGAAQVPRVG